MKLLLSTTKTQGLRPDDFSFTTEGEIVLLPWFSTGCDDPDGPCGCGRAMFGIHSGKATTTILVADAPVTKEGLREAVSDSFRRNGFRRDDEAVEDMCLDLIDLAALFGVGEIVERRGDQYLVRGTKFGIG